VCNAAAGHFITAEALHAAICLSGISLCITSRRR
jgi:hypothetical protein